jgi:hypothetical protein
VAESQGLTAGVHPNLEARDGDDHPGQGRRRARPSTGPARGRPG